jgi:hypothetical protein
VTDTLTMLLPERRRFGVLRLSPAVAKLLARADRLEAGGEGERAQLERYFQAQPRGWPMAAMQRQAECGDAAGFAWLRADPVHVRPDISGARLLAWGNLGLSAQEADALLEALRPTFGEAAMPLSRGVAENWYLQLSAQSPLPAFSPPEAGLGDDLFRHLPEGPQGRRWRALLNEAQVLLHQHPVNAQRLAAGELPANSLWFWGGGTLPDSLRCSANAVVSRESDLRALAFFAQVEDRALARGDTLIDLRRERDWRRIEAEHLGKTLATDFARYPHIDLDFADGARYRLEARQRWRFWRRAPERWQE